MSKKGTVFRIECMCYMKRESWQYSCKKSGKEKKDHYALHFNVWGTRNLESEAYNYVYLLILCIASQYKSLIHLMVMQYQEYFHNVHKVQYNFFILLDWYGGERLRSRVDFTKSLSLLLRQYTNKNVPHLHYLHYRFFYFFIYKTNNIKFRYLLPWLERTMWDECILK